MSCSLPVALFGYLFHGLCADAYATPPPLWDAGASLYAFYFAFSLLIELPIYVLLLRRALGTRRAILAAIVVNALTHPLVCLVFPRFFQGGSYAAYLCYSEIFAPVTEAAVLAIVYRVPGKQAVLSSLLANLASWLIGGTLLALWLEG